MRFLNKVVVITGASSGIGAELAKQLSREGAILALLARRKESLDTLARELSTPERQCLAFRCDVTDPSQLASAFFHIRERLGPPHIVIANAGFGVVGKVEKLTTDDFRKQFETNIFGVINTVKAALEDLKQTKGQLVIVGSVNGFVSIPGNSPYGMSKAAVRSLAYSLRHELSPFGVAVTHIAPGFVDSEIRFKRNDESLSQRTRDPIPSWIRVPTPKAVQHIIHAVARRKRESVITRHGKAVVFVSRHFPRVFDWLVGKSQVKSRQEPR